MLPARSGRMSIDPPIEVGSVITHPQFSHVYFRPFIGVVTLFIRIVGVHLVETICLL